MGRATAGVAEPCADASAIYVNPAGLAGQTGMIVSGGSSVISGSEAFTSDSSVTTDADNPLGVAPHGYFQQGINEKLAWGVGVYAPYGLRVRWPLDFGGRFVSFDSSLSTLYVQPTIAYAPTPRFSVGAGLTIARSSVDLKRREDLARVPLPVAPGLTFGALVNDHTDFEETTLSASGATGIGANLGAIVSVHDRVRVGARYLTQVSLEYDGTAEFVPIGQGIRVTKPNPLGLPVGTPLDPFVSQIQASLQDQSATTELTMPAQFLVGLSVHVADRVKLFGDYQWVGWSEFDTVTLDFSQPLPPDEDLVQNYRDTNAVLVGAEVDVRPAFRLRGGYFYNEAAAPDETVTPLLPDASRTHISAGFGWNPRSWLTIDAAYMFIRHADRRGRIVNPPPGTLPSVALNSGVYRARADLFAITLVFRR
jgi:long-chain fatty acid transport protein